MSHHVPRWLVYLVLVLTSRKRPNVSVAIMSAVQTQTLVYAIQLILQIPNDSRSLSLFCTLLLQQASLQDIFMHFLLQLHCNFCRKTTANAGRMMHRRHSHWRRRTASAHKRRRRRILWSNEGHLCTTRHQRKLTHFILFPISLSAGTPIWRRPFGDSRSVELIPGVEG